MKEFLLVFAGIWCLTLFALFKNVINDHTLSSAVNRDELIPSPELAIVTQNHPQVESSISCTTSPTNYIPTYERELSKILISSVENIGKPVFLSLSDTNIFQVEMNYLGRIITDETCYKFLNVINYTGTSSRRANAGVCLYNGLDELLGRYYLGGIWGLPDSIAGTELIFMNNEDCAEISRIDFSEGLLDTMFVSCNDGYGDFWGFSPVDSLR